MDIVLLNKGNIQAAGIVLTVRQMATLTIAWPWLHNVIRQWSTCAGARFYQPLRWKSWISVQVCHGLNQVQVQNDVQVFDLIYVTVAFAKLRGIKMSGSTPIIRILLVFQCKVFRMLCYLICLSHQLSEVNFFRHENSGQRKGDFRGIVDDMRGVDYTL